MNSRNISKKRIFPWYIYPNNTVLFTFRLIGKKGWIRKYIEEGLFIQLRSFVCENIVQLHKHWIREMKQHLKIKENDISFFLFSSPSTVVYIKFFSPCFYIFYLFSYSFYKPSYFYTITYNFTIKEFIFNASTYRTLDNMKIITSTYNILL